MNGFNIIHDNTIAFETNQKLYVMLIQVDGKYYFRVDDKRTNVANIMVPDNFKERQDYFFLFNRLTRMKNFISCKSLLQLSLNRYNYSEAKFLIHLITSGEITSQLIFSLRKQYGFKTEIEFGDDEENYFMINEAVVHFPGAKKSIGKFLRKKNTEEYQFILNNE